MRKIKVYTHIDDYGQMVDNIRVKVDNKINIDNVCVELGALLRSEWKGLVKRDSFRRVGRG